MFDFTIHGAVLVPVPADWLRLGPPVVGCAIRSRDGRDGVLL